VSPIGANRGSQRLDLNPRLRGTYARRMEHPIKDVKTPLLRLASEASVKVSTRTIDLVADRIERAYTRRHFDAPCYTWDARIWSLAAMALLEENRRTRWLPIDPELFVASLCESERPADPWADLAPRVAIRRYRRRIVHIVKKLRAELRREVARVESEISSGKPLERLLSRRRRWLSPMGRYVVAYRAGREDLLDDLRSAARDQHDACPLYRRACAGLVPESAYPAVELVPGIAQTPRTHRQDLNAVSLN
jgi:hypothetical protein